MSSVLQNIRRRYPEMSKGQKAIADFILSNCEETAHMTAARLGKASRVSESTVVRFAMELGYAGFPEFKNLREDLKVDLTAAQRMKASAHLHESPGKLYGSILQGDADRLRKVAETRDAGDFEQAIELFSAAETIYILGVRSSAPLASFMYFYFNQIFPSVRLIQANYSSEILEQMIDIGPDDVLAVMSFPVIPPASCMRWSMLRERVPEPWF